MLLSPIIYHYLPLLNRLVEPSCNFDPSPDAWPRAANSFDTQLREINSRNSRTTKITTATTGMWTPSLTVEKIDLHRLLIPTALWNNCMLTDVPIRSRFGICHRLGPRKSLAVLKNQESWNDSFGWLQIDAQRQHATVIELNGLFVIWSALFQLNLFYVHHLLLKDPL